MTDIVTTVLNISGASGYDDDGSDFDILRDLLITADLAGAVATTPDITVFAPEDDAFIGLAGTIAAVTGNHAPVGEEATIGFLADALTLLGGGNPIPLLTDILTYHVAPELINSDKLLNDGGADMLNGGSITASVTSTDPLVVTLGDNDPVVADPTLDVSRINLDGGNGLIHVLEGVLLSAPVAATLTAPNTDFEIGDDSDQNWFTGRGADFVDGNGGNDIIRTGSGMDVAIGGAGNDYVSGGRGSDTLLGGDGDDIVYGGRGNDDIEGGAGDDILFGGQGADAFIFKKGSEDDLIVNFGAGADVIDLSGYEGIDDFHDIEDSISGGFFFSHIDLLHGDSISLIGFNVHNLDADDFVF